MKITKNIILLLAVVTVMISGCSKDNPTDPGNPGGTISVNGKLINTVGYPVMNATVSIGTLTTTSAADGTFTLNDITTPYDLNIVSGVYGVQYKGLTSSTPKVLTLGATTIEKTATINVTVPALGTGQYCRLFYTDEQTIQSTALFTGVSSTSFIVRWSSGDNVNGKLIALIYTITGGEVTTYDKFGMKTNFALNNGGTSSYTFTASDLNLNPTEVTVTGTVNSVFNYTAVNSISYLSFLNNYIGIGSLNSSSGNTFTFKYPGGLPLNVYYIAIGGGVGASGSGSTYKHVNEGSGNIITLESPTMLSSPPDNSTMIDTGTTFSFTPGSGQGINSVTFVSGTKAFRVFTAESTVRIPNLSMYGFNLEPATIYNWSVNKYTTFNNLDEFIAAPVNASSQFSSTTFSSTRVFTTKP